METTFWGLGLGLGFKALWQFRFFLERRFGVRALGSLGMGSKAVGCVGFGGLGP